MNILICYTLLPLTAVAAGLIHAMEEVGKHHGSSVYIIDDTHYG